MDPQVDSIRGPGGDGGPGTGKDRLTPEAQAIIDSFTRFNAYIAKGRPERVREAGNHDLNDGTSNRHWAGLSAEDLNLMAREGRGASTVNFTKQAVATVAGNIIADKFEGEYLAGYGESQIPPSGLHELYLRDFNMGQWEGKITKWLREAFIYRGTLAWYISTEFDPRGQLALQHIQPGRLIYDPNWMTTDVNDNNRIFEYTYSTARKILEEFGEKADWLRPMIGSLGDGESSSSGMLVTAFDMNPDMRIDLDGELLIVNEYWLEAKVEYRVFDSLNTKYLDEIPQEHRKSWVENERMAGGLESHGLVSLVPVKSWVEKFITYCPAASTNKALAKGNYPIQMNGYHFLPLTSDLLNGKPNTVTDQLADPQRMVNKRMSTETYILATSTTNGVIANPLMFSTPEEFDRWINEGHRPGYKGAASDAASQGQHKFIEMPRGSAQSNFIDSTKNLMAIKDQVLPSVNALGGIGDPGQSGVAYQAQVNQANITLVIPKTFIKEGYHRLYEMYHRGAKDLYTFPIVVHGQQSNNVYKFNYGTPDSITIPDRIGISIQESPNSASKRSVMVTEAGAAMQYLDPNSLQKKVLGGVIAENLPHLNDEHRMRLEQANKIEQELAFTLAEVALEQAKSQLKQARGEAGPPAPQEPKPSISLTAKMEELTPEGLEILYANGYKRPEPPAPVEAATAPLPGAGAMGAGVTTMEPQMA